MHGAVARDSIGEALRFVRENAPFIAWAAVAGAAAIALISVIAGAAPQLGAFALLAPGVVQAYVYAAFSAALLFGAGGVRARILRDGARVWLAMAIIGFFLFIVFVVIGMPLMFILTSGPLAPYTEELTRAGQDQAAVLAIAQRFAEENPGVILLITLLLGGLWLALTSRLYLAAPASIDQGRILTFHTWKWTKGAMLRIMGARLLLLVPANILAGALGYLAGRVLGFDTMNLAGMGAAAQANPAGMMAAAFVANFFSLALFSALEAGLSAALYKRMRPQS